MKLSHLPYPLLFTIFVRKNQNLRAISSSLALMPRNFRILGCSTVMPINLDDFLSYFLMGAPFQSSKGSSMDTISQSVLLDPLGEEQPHFNDKAKAYVHSFNLVLFIAFSWCKCTNSFQNCSLTNPIATWKIFL